MMQSGAAASLPEKLDHHAKMSAGHLAELCRRSRLRSNRFTPRSATKLYASFSDEQKKKFADGLQFGPMGVM